MAIIKIQRKIGIRYMVRVKDKYGKPYPAKTFDRKVDAIRYETTLKTKRDQGKLAHSQEIIRFTFAEYWVKWAESMRGHVSDGWKISQDQMARDHILPWIGHMRLLNIRPVEIQEVINQVRAKGLSEQTQLHVYNLMHKCFEDAVHILELLDKNPVLRKFKPKPRLKTRRHLVPKDLLLLLDRSRNHYLGPAIWLASLAGLRTEAIQALTWSCVDFDRGMIHIRQAYKAKVRRIEPYPKGRDQTSVPLPRLLAEYLKEKRGTSGSRFVAPNSEGGILDYDNTRKVLKKYCVEVGVMPITLHELRHSCTELWVTHGATVEDVRRLLNHKSSATTARYIHRTDDRLRAIAEGIDFVRTDARRAFGAGHDSGGARTRHDSGRGFDGGGGRHGDGAQSGPGHFSDTF